MWGVLFWWTRGESFLIFARHLGIFLLLCLAKIFGHRSQTTISVVCFTAFDLSPQPTEAISYFYEIPRSVPFKKRQKKTIKKPPRGVVFSDLWDKSVCSCKALHNINAPCPKHICRIAFFQLSGVWRFYGE